MSWGNLDFGLLNDLIILPKCAFMRDTGMVLLHKMMHEHGSSTDQLPHNEEMT
jgi:hypothetical protein